MKTRLSRVVDIPFSVAAIRRLRRLTGLYATALTMHAKTLAYEQEESEVLLTHVNQAHAVMEAQRESYEWRKVWGGILGGMLLGTFLPGIGNELAKPTGSHTILLALYIACGFLGPLLIFLTHRK